ncbi:hypothetical protein BaRGS_00026971, partial [Batillaria attramentaria]
LQRLTYLRVAVDRQIAFESAGTQPAIHYKDNNQYNDPYFDITGDGPDIIKMPVTGRNLTITRYGTTPEGAPYTCLSTFVKYRSGNVQMVDMARTVIIVMVTARGILVTNKTDTVQL